MVSFPAVRRALQLRIRTKTNFCRSMLEMPERYVD
jgi:hypothetical protein